MSETASSMRRKKRAPPRQRSSQGSKTGRRALNYVLARVPAETADPSSTITECLIPVEAHHHVDLNVERRRLAVAVVGQCAARIESWSADSDGPPDREAREIERWAHKHEVPYFDEQVHSPGSPHRGHVEDSYRTAASFKTGSATCSAAMKRLRELTRRERDVLSVLCRPLAQGAAFTEPASVHAIADALGVSAAAVKQHLTHLYDKFGIFEGEQRRRLRLANMALSEGAVPAETMRAASQGPAADLLADGRAAVLLRNWPRVYELLTRADQEGSALSPEDLEWLGEAAMMTGRHDESIAARQRAHATHVRDNNVVRAAGVELALVYNYVGRLNFAQASAWFSKAQRSLEAAPPGPAHGYLAVTAALFMHASGNFERALELARDGCRIGEQLRDPDLHALGLVLQGQALAQLGNIVEATPLFDEAMASATDGELGPLATGLVYCRTICSCLEALDYRRAREWTETIDRVAGDHCTAGFPGDCRAHRATLLAARGDWSAAESEARVACAEKERIDLSHSGIANYEIGQLRLRTGDFASATVAFQRAHELGMSPQPGLALLHLERGDIEAATASIRTAVGETAPKSLRRARLLQAHVELACVAGDSTTARTAANELASIAEIHPNTALKASAMSALGVASLTERKWSPALRELRQACRLWLETDAPYDAARVRTHTAAALRALDDKASAIFELEAARATFERLGARPDAARASRALTELGANNTG